jgi:hypothetical protein
VGLLYLYLLQTPTGFDTGVPFSGIVFYFILLRAFVGSYIDILFQFHVGYFVIKKYFKKIYIFDFSDVCIFMYVYQDLFQRNDRPCIGPACNK